MTEKEINILYLLEKLYEEYIELEQQHPDDKKEFINALHVLQHLIMIRSVRRKYKDLFPVNNNDIAIEQSLSDLISVEVKKKLNGE